MSETPRVLVLLGSRSDLGVMEETAAALRKLEIPFQMTVRSAHRTPGETVETVREAEERGAQVVICAAGLAAHLAGVVASHTMLPVIGVPMPGGPGGGLDALLSTVQMPGGIPVATVALGKAGARNAAFLAARILALGDPALADRLETHRQGMARQVLSDAAAVERDHSGRG
jgi:5-(carboxyamino)imidazole ribonucleotide mutase